MYPARMSFVFLLTGMVACACGGQETNPSIGDTTAASVVDSDTMHQWCVALMERQRECTNEFIPALVAKRIELAKPSKIVALEQEIGRDALVREAKKEWAEDSTDARIESVCGKIVKGLPQEAQEHAQHISTTCLGSEECSEFVRCIMPLVETHL